MVPIHPFASRYVPFLANVLLIGVALFFLQYNPYYEKALRSETHTILTVLAACYVLGGAIFYTFLPPEGRRFSVGQYIFVWVWDFVLQRTHHAQHGDTPVAQDASLVHEVTARKNAVLFFLVKLFFLPLMINFTIINWEIVSNQADLFAVEGFGLSLMSFNFIYFPFIFASILFVDTLYFVFGYLFEASVLGNKVRSVEPTLLGWLVTIVCYPPFNGIMTQFTGWYANEYVTLSSDWATTLFRALIILCFAVYLFATLALGTKCSNLTNRGTVARGPYAWVRHPAYFAKNLGWWIAALPVLNVFGFVSLCVWTGVYMLRALTEERHLMQDPDYRAYAARVRYRFIPGVW